MKSCRKSWYSFVSESCILEVEYMFIVLKKEMSLSNNPKDLPPALARISPNLSQVQWGINTDFTSCPAANAFDCTSSITSLRNWWKALLHRPVIKWSIVVNFRESNKWQNLLQTFVSMGNWAQYCHFVSTFPISETLRGWGFWHILVTCIENQKGKSSLHFMVWKEPAWALCLG